MAINIKPQTLRSQIFILATGIILGIMVMYLINTKKNATVQISHNMVLQEIESLGNLEVTNYIWRSDMLCRPDQTKTRRHNRFRKNNTSTTPLSRNMPCKS